MSATRIPVSAIVPTLNRAAALRRTLASLEGQGLLPLELIVVDASPDGATREVVDGFAGRWDAAPTTRWFAATRRGAAAQRNQGVALATQPFVWFFDDDVLFEPECVRRLWGAMQSDARLGAVNAMIVNQRYQAPGTVSRLLFRLLSGRGAPSYAGRVLGPAVNLLPEDDETLPEVVTVDWLNTTCTLYRREALPAPPFDSAFTGYSMMEDLALSLRVARTWRLANARTARVVHDSQPGEDKADVAAMAAMELANRHYVMTEVLGRRGLADHLRLLLWESFQLASCLGRSGAQFPAMLRGKVRGVGQIRRRTRGALA